MSESVLLTVRLHTRKRQRETRKYLAPKKNSDFHDLVEKLEKLFRCKICRNSCVYLDDNGDRISFSSDEELALALLLAKDDNLQLDVHETEVQVLREDNPSEISTDCNSSLNSSLGHHGNSPSSLSSADKTVEASTTPKSTLFRSFILPKLSRQFESSPQVPNPPATKSSQSAHSVERGTAKFSGEAASVELANSPDHSGLVLLQETKRNDLLYDSRSVDVNALGELLRALFRVALWLGQRLG